MKILILSILSILSLSTQLIAQSAVTVTSNSKDVRFYLIVGGQQMNDFFETYVQVQNIPAGYQEVKVVFEGDSVADVFKNVMLKNGQEKIFLVSQKKDFKKSVNKSGRSVGKAVDVGEHNESFDYLQDMYQMSMLSKAAFVVTGTELNVSTEKTLSTSITPASKQKH